MTQTPAVIHDFPSSTPQLERNQQQAADIITRAFNYLCRHFPAFGTRDEAQANIDARVLLIYARDAVYSQTELFQGHTFAAAEGLVDRLVYGKRSAGVPCWQHDSYRADCPDCYREEPIR